MSSIEFLNRHSPLHRSLVVSPRVLVTPLPDRDRFVATVDGRHPLTLTREVAHLLVDLRQAQTVVQVARISSLPMREVVEVLELLERKGFVRSPDAPTSPPPRLRVDTSAFPILRLDPTVKAAWTDRLAKTLAPLLHPKVMALGVVLAFVLLLGHWLAPTSPQAPDLPSFWRNMTLLVVLVLCSLIHELGHIVACRRCGIDHGGLGLAVYLIFPAMYVDVSAVHHLDRRGRLLVNGAGLYFNVLTLVVLLVCERLWPAPLTTHLVQALVLTIAWNALPLRRLDGDWLARDLLEKRPRALQIVTISTSLAIGLFAGLAALRIFATYGWPSLSSCPAIAPCWRAAWNLVFDQPVLIGALTVSTFCLFHSMKSMYALLINKQLRLN